jgi:hypothetical protein
MGSVERKENYPFSPNSTKKDNQAKGKPGYEKWCIEEVEAAKVISPKEICNADNKVGISAYTAHLYKSKPINDRIFFLMIWSTELNRWLIDRTILKLT